MSSQEPGWIAVVGWDEMTHRDAARGPGALPWVRSFARLMQDDAYMALSPVRVAMYHRIVLAYAQSRSRLRADTLQLNRRLGLRVRQEDLKALEQAGLIKVCASIVQAEGWHKASVHVARDRYREREIPKDVNQGTKERPQEDIERTTGNGRLDALLPAPDPHVTALSAARARIGKEMP